MVQTLQAAVSGRGRGAEGDVRVKSGTFDEDPDDALVGTRSVRGSPGLMVS